jgi:hypothetical protein
MAPRPTRNKLSVDDLSDLIQHKVDEAAFFLQHLKRIKEQQRRPEKPSPAEFSYYLSAFLGAAYTVGKLIERKRKKWWEQLSQADRALYELMIPAMRGDAVHQGQVETERRIDEVPVRFDPTRYLQGQPVQNVFFQSMFGEVTTSAETHSVKLEGEKREVVELCGQYLDLLKRETV